MYDLMKSTSETGEILEKFTPKKTRNEWLFNSYKRIPGFESRALRVYDCGQWLEFGHEVNQGVVADAGKLHRASFCRDRLCPMCNWRRRLKLYNQVSRIIDSLDGCRYIFVTFTVPNVPGDQLSGTMDDMNQAFKLMFHPRDGAMKDISLGYIRNMEVTYNKRADTYHPHFHVIVAVKPSYFSGRNYKKQAWFVDRWLEALRSLDRFSGLDRVVCDVRAVKPGRDGRYTSTVAEISKYASKDTDYLKEIANDQDLIVLETIARALKGRRLISFGGCCREAWKKLRMDDVEDGDLIHVADDDDILAPEIIVFHYAWAGRFKGYMLQFCKEEKNSTKVQNTS